MLVSWIREHPFFLPFFCILLACLFLLSQFNNLLFTSMTEVFTVAVASVIFIMAWNARWRTGDHFLLVLGTGFLCFAYFDFLHYLANEDMRVFQDQTINLSYSLEIAGHYALMTTFLTAPLFFSRRVKPWILILNVMGVTGLVTSLIFLNLFPVCFSADQGTTLFARLSEFAICLGLTAAIVLLHRNREQLDPSIRMLIQTSIGLIILQELITGISAAPSGPTAVISSFFKIMSIYLLYKAVLETGLREPQRVLFMELERGRRLLMEAEKRFRTITDGAPIGIFRSNPEGRYEYSNPRLAQIYGYDSPSDLMNSVTNIGQDIYVDLDRWRNMRKQLEDVDILYDIEALIRRKDGSTLWTSRDIRVHRDIKGRMLYYDGFVSDISDQKKLETLREDVDRILRHDLKAPLISFSSGLGMVRATCRPDHRGELLIREMEQSAMQMLGLIDLSMGLHKMESGDYDLETGPVNLIEMLRTVFSAHHSLIRGKNLNFEIILNGVLDTGEHPCLIDSEAILCHALLSNLIRNAMEASPENETVTAVLQSGEHPTLTVTNRGEVPLAIRDRFFEKYTTHGKPQGTGLGTYSARLIAETHGWSIAMHSDKGTTSVRVEFTSAV
ncbi:MAG: PAS domain S-box protein [Proteobacteria bacterium]|nr:PAS domain S-box protein [Pseudomonadota bacterium]MBU1611541.1 PAS domain S-box protein [Pseudomonadota bacterium]